MTDSPNPTEARVLNEVASGTDDPSLLVDTPQEELPPVYKATGESRIPVSKHAGKLWQSRRDVEQAKLEKSGKIANWEECIRYYKNDQGKNRTGSARRTRNDRGQGDTENIVFANTSALVPSTYAKNPRVEITPNVRDDDQPQGST
jgi:hypothetical protein